MSYNVHGLEHLAEDAAVLGPLDEFSGFKFENFLGYLKSLLKKPNAPLQQVHRRKSDRILQAVKSMQNLIDSVWTTHVINVKILLVRMTKLFQISNTSKHSRISKPKLPQPQFQNLGETLMEFDKKLECDEAFRKSCVTYLANIGGNDLTTAVYEVLKQILTYKLAYTTKKNSLSWVQHAGDHLPKSHKLGTKRTSSTEQA
ncbi:unnamed protein product [Allacma fusca]|uniref:Uncharacterized protein n=1 Tax=Allacma fusca TaxID=39272 RepID=A0A8J2K9V0_9HEXA|nr:unnamed protein product [Allacma fusca]